MKNIAWISTLGLAALFAVAAAPALSDSDNAATKVRAEGCTLYDGNGVLTFVPDADFFVIINNNGRVNSCSAKGMANDTGSAAHFDAAGAGVLCNADGVITDDWTENVSASGNATITCRVRNH